ncbi:hypothetical protein QH494_03815 [Sphingomonas sp. AR_OL41]|uniref:hypothetical protein n=1 Tax=Sphingomonas sp. AR_OL41 TaxID=3042729 RepID=UPI002480618B|nr:hypothetical protein [Sphingomonas sp. AR_OL41]MDH7971297.1 hypothetical protein [Sphingomonas sp. AR_OL41]
MSDFTFIPGESFNGAIARWAAENDVERMIDVTRAAGLVHPHRQTAGRAEPEGIAAISAEMDVCIGALAVLATPLDGPDLGQHSRRLLNGVSVPSALLETRRRRIAPAAFAPPPVDELAAPPPHHRALWDFRLLPACTETWQYLVHRCGNDDCGDLGWHHTPGIDLCEHCMGELADTPAGDVEPELRECLAHVAGLVHHDPARRAASLALLSPAIADMGAPVAIDLVYRLLPVITPGLPSPPHSLANADPRTLAIAVVAAWKFATDWPHGALAHIGNLVSRRATRHSDGNRGETMRFLDMGRLLGLRPEVEDLAAALRWELDIKGPHGATLERATRTSSEAVQLLSVGSQLVARFRRSGALATIPVLVHGTLQPRLSADDLELVADGISRRIGVDTLQSRFGISHHGVEQLEALGLIHLLRHPYFEARYTARQVDMDSVVDLERALADAAASGDPDRCTRPLVDAMKAVGGRMKPWGPVLDAIRLNRIPVSLTDGNGPLSSRLLIDPGSIGLVTAATFVAPTGWGRPAGALVTKVDAAETLNLCPKQSTKLLTRFPTVSGSHAKSVPVDQLLEIARRQISSVELAARRGISPAAAYFEARRDKVPWLGHAGFCRATAERTYLADGGPARGACGKDGRPG